MEWLKDQEHLWKAPSAEPDPEADPERKEQEVSHEVEIAEAAPAAWYEASHKEAAARFPQAAAAQASIVHGEPFVERKSAFQVPEVAPDNEIFRCSARQPHAMDWELGALLALVSNATCLYGMAQAHLAPVTTAQAAADVVAALLQNGKIQRATHNIMAYRIRIPGKDTFLQAWPGDKLKGTLHHACLHACMHDVRGMQADHPCNMTPCSHSQIT